MSAPEPAVAESAHPCDNCGTPLLGEHCYACGQPTKGMVRHFSSILGDFFDTVLNIDSRVLRTLWPLIARPGYLSLEYFAGRRVRYVTPVRLYLFLSVIVFFAMQGSITVEDDGAGKTQAGEQTDSLSRAQTPAEVEKALTEARRGFEQARKAVANTPGAAGIAVAEAKIEERAKQRLAYLQAVADAKAKGVAPPAPPEQNDRGVGFDVKGKPWDPKTNPVAIAWLPAAANASLNRRIARARDVLKSSNSEKPLLDAMFNVLPQTLFVLMPLFALMLKVAYYFKRRLYMEHLIVALHSHSFLALTLTAIIGLSDLQSWLVPNGGFISGVLGWAMGLLGLWIPVYLLLMQKRVYGQGWPMTLLKYGVLGISYTLLLSFGVVAAILIGLLTL